MIPVVSVIIPTYRRTDLLKKALLSVCQQDYPDVEIVVVDDNGLIEWNRRVEEIVREVRPRLSDGHTLRLLTNPHNLGAAQSRNAGIHASRGAYLTFLDDDDCYLPTKISTQLALMLQQSADYSLMDLDLFNGRNRLVEHKAHPYLRNHPGREELIRLHLMHHLTGTDTMMFRRDYLLSIGCFGTIDIGDEFYLMMRAIEGGGRLAYLPRALVHARVHYDGSGLSGGVLKIEGEQRLFAFQKKYFPLLSPGDVRYVRMRHHAVLAFAHLRLKHPARFAWEAAGSILASPLACARMLLQRKQ